MSRFLRKPFYEFRQKRRISRLHADLARQQRAIDVIEAAGTAAEVDRGVKLFRRSLARRSRMRVLVFATALAVTASGSVAAVTITGSDGKPRSAVQSSAYAIGVRAPRCLTFRPPPAPDVQLGGHGPEYKFEDGGLLVHSFFSLYHPRGFSAAPLYSKHYELFVKRQRTVRIRIGWTWPTGATDPQPYVTTFRREFRRLPGFRDLGARQVIFGCQRAIRWEYEHTAGGMTIKSVRYFLAAISRARSQSAAYDVLFEAPTAEFRRWTNAFGLVKRSFRVNHGIENAEIHSG